MRNRFNPHNRTSKNLPALRVSEADAPPSTESETPQEEVCFSRTFNGTAEEHPILRVEP